MKKIKQFLTSPAATVAAFVLAVALLLFSSIGGARAALAYYSENYSTRVQMYDIGVTLEENGKSVSWRNYDTNSSDGSWNESAGALLTQMLPKGEQLQIGKKYKEELRVKNTGTINQYVRVSIYKYWINAPKGENQNETESSAKRIDLSPNLIKLHLANTGNKWLVDESASTTERTVLYYSKLLKSGDTTPIFADSFSIDGMVATKVTQTTETKDGYTTVTTSYDYDGAQFCIEAKVDAVQEHNAEDAVWSAWGKRVTVDNGTLSLD